jgi:ubiquinone/menaquinone biosynthesis C-methylase UbiE
MMFNIKPPAIFYFDAQAARSATCKCAIFIVMNFSDPKSNVLQMGLKDGMKVGDFGVGSGHYAIAVAGVIGPEGRVYAVDVQEDVLKHAQDSAHRAGHRNVTSIWGDFDKPRGSKIGDHVLDAVILSNVLFQLDHPEGAVTEIKRTLKAGGKLMVIDWAGSYAGMGPSHDRLFPEHKAEELFIKHGFHKVKDFRAGAHHYAIIFTAP